MPTGIWLSVRPLAIESIYSLSLKYFRADENGDIITADPDFPEGSKNYDLAHEFLVKVLLGNESVLSSEFIASKDNDLHLKRSDLEFKEGPKNLVVEIHCKVIDDYKNGLMSDGEKTAEDWVLRKSIDYCDDLESLLLSETAAVTESLNWSDIKCEEFGYTPLDAEEVNWKLFVRRK
jgi:hypothetical protein